MGKHPNAATAAGSAWLVAAVLWFLGVVGVQVPDPPLEVAIGLGGTAAGFVLFVGREGVRGVIRRVWRGTS